MLRITNRVCGHFIFLGIFLFLQAVQAEEQVHPLEPGDNSSPRATLKTFIDSSNAIFEAIQEDGIGAQVREREEIAIEVDRLFRCLNVGEEASYRREATAKEAAVCLKEVLDRIAIPPDIEIPGIDPTEDIQLPPLADKPITNAASNVIDKLKKSVATEKTPETTAPIPLPDLWRLPHTDITITRIEEGPRRGEYLFSPDTISRAREFYQRVAKLPYRKTGPKVSKGFYEWFMSEPRSEWMAKFVHRLPPRALTRFYGHAVWQWVGLFVVTILGLFVMLLAYRIGRWRPKHYHRLNIIQYCFTMLFPMAAMLIPIAVEAFVADQLVISGITLNVVKFTTGIVFLFTVLVVIVSAGNRISEIIITSPRIHPKGLDAQLIRIISRVVSLAAAIIVFLEGGKYMGIPLTTLLAGAGVGGLAIALSAQDAMKNLFGSVMIILDKPYRIGERIAVKNYDGVVEEIGLRSTKIRLLNGHQTSIPNEEMARSDIENIGRRPHVRRIANLQIPLDTSPKKAQQALDIVRNILDDHEGMKPEYPPRVFFNELNRDALNIRMMYWYHPAEYWEYLRFSEDVNLRILKEFAEAEIPLALPATTNFLAQDSDRPVAQFPADSKPPEK